MTYTSERLSNGNVINYKITESGTAYHAETPMQVIAVLEKARMNRQRIKVYFGNTETGKDWNEEHDTIGYIGRSGGTIKIPLLVHNARSLGGGALLDHCIVKIKEAKGGLVLYQHPKYNTAKIEIVPSDMPEYTHAITIDGQIYSRHKSEKSAKLLLNKLS